MFYKISKHFDLFEDDGKFSSLQENEKEILKYVVMIQNWLPEIKLADLESDPEKMARSLTGYWNILEHWKEYGYPVHHSYTTYADWFDKFLKSKGVSK